MILCKNFLTDKLSQDGGALLIEVIKKLENNSLVSSKQNDKLSCYAGKISKKLLHSKHSKNKYNNRIQIPIGFDTDVNGAAIGECRWGRGKGLEDLVYCTVEQE